MKTTLFRDATMSIVVYGDGGDSAAGIVQPRNSTRFPLTNNIDSNSNNKIIMYYICIRYTREKQYVCARDKKRMAKYSEE